MRARRAGRSRVRAWRPSPGCGVNRRCRAASTLSLRSPLCVQEAVELAIQEADEGGRAGRASRWGRLGDLWLRVACSSLVWAEGHGPSVVELSIQEADECQCARGASRWGRLGDLWLRVACWSLVWADACASGVVGDPELKSSGEDTVSRERLRGAMQAGGVRVVSCGARLAAYRAKCLHACVVDSLVGTQRQRVAERLLSACRNDDGSGFGGSLREARNAEAARCLLYTSPSPRDQRGSRMPSSA